MRTESLRRVYCDVMGCRAEPVNVWLPFDTDGIIEALLDRGFKVETRRVSYDGHPCVDKLGRVTCPSCAEEA